MIPTKRQQTLLAGLAGDDVWTSLLKDIEADREIKPWKPGGNEEEKSSKWIFESGARKGVSDILEILRLGK